MPVLYTTYLLFLWLFCFIDVGRHIVTWAVIALPQLRVGFGGGLDQRRTVRFRYPLLGCFGKMIHLLD
jgi:hypothetical protein